MEPTEGAMVRYLRDRRLLFLELLCLYLILFKLINNSSQLQEGARTACLRLVEDVICNVFPNDFKQY